MTKTQIVNGIHNYTDPVDYIAPKNPQVLQHLEWFMDQKLGFMMHWAPGCQLGTYESWPLSDGDGSWSQKDFTWADIPTCKQQYVDSNRTFHPVKFRPDKWAALAKDCGFKYLLFTTKHHDGFCMYDTKTTDYKITGKDCPFHTHPYADITGSLFQEFRKAGLGISAYFSKPDWHSQYYWAAQFGTAPDRNVNYSPEEYPHLWAKYVDFTHEQMREICTQYGKIDVLWLDGGWVRPDNKGQDIQLEKIIEEIRRTTQPHLIVSDRTCGGNYENFITPEKTIPESALSVPWETCITLGEKFSFHYTDHFKSGRELVHILLDVVSKGGNLALNLAPQPDGELPLPAIHSLHELGSWLSIFKEGIYGTRICPPFFTENLYFTKKDRRVFVFYRYDKNCCLPKEIRFPLDVGVEKVTGMRTHTNVKFRQSSGNITLFPESLSLEGAFYAEGFCLELSSSANSKL